MLWVTGSLDVRGKAEIASFEKKGGSPENDEFKVVSKRG
jgi:hypothetical protein